MAKGGKIHKYAPYPVRPTGISSQGTKRGGGKKKKKIKRNTRNGSIGGGIKRKPTNIPIGPTPHPGRKHKKVPWEGLIKNNKYNEGQ